MRKKLLASILILIAMSWIFSDYAFSAKKQSKKAKAKKESKTKAKDKSKAQKKEKKREIKYTGVDTKRDPFKAPKVLATLLSRPETVIGTKVMGPEKLPAVVIQGIISGRFPQVIINDDVYKVGDYLEKFEIKEVNKKGIILFFKGRDYIITMQNNTKSKKTRRKR